MNAVHCFIAGSSAQRGSVASLWYAVVMRPTDFSRPAGVSTDPTEIETLLRYWTGFQPMSYALRIACAANLGVVTLKNTFAPEACSCTICESTVGSLTSYDTSATIMLFALAPRPSF